MPTSAGTKVTTDPQSRIPKHETTGGILSDSLAAESLTQGGDFAEGQSATPMKQSSLGTTTNVTDTHSAIKLDAAPDAELREQKQGGSNPQGTLDRGIGEGKNAGRGPTYNTSSGGGSGTGSGSRTSDAGNGAAAPNYAAAREEEGKPHGKNLKEGGFEGNEKNASYTTDIGGEEDPGRQALGDMQGRNARAAGDDRTDTKGTNTGGAYDALDEVQS